MNARRFGIVATAILFALTAGCGRRKQGVPHADFSALALKPPMGWNSWNCFGSDVNEEQVRANADYMSEKLKAHGWEYIVVDLGWYLPPEITIATFKRPRPLQAVDDFGRLVPDEKKFPSAARGGGFRMLADSIHRKGLKFGIHIMRGIPRQAVERNTPVYGSRYTARDAAAPLDTCTWYDGMFGVDASGPAGRAYYTSILRLYAEWGVDYIKADDMSQPYHAADIEALHAAILSCGRPIVLSLSPGASPLDRAEHLEANANLWRISPDFWDMWQPLKRQFDLCREWAPHVEPGHWPDCDMIPMGKLRITGPDDYVAGLMGKKPEEITDEFSRFTADEKTTLMTLWSVFRSPLMFGGDLPETDSLSLALITNDEVLAVNQTGRGGRELRSERGRMVWTAELPEAGARVAALFNLGDAGIQEIRVTFRELGLPGRAYLVRDLWKKKDLGLFTEAFTAKVNPHGAGMFRISALSKSGK
jgi:alpha-galactosidase